MKLSDLLGKLKSEETRSVRIAWHCDPAEGIDFILPEELLKPTTPVENGVALLQWAILRSAEEAELALKNHKGYTVLTDDFVALEPDFYQVFDFPKEYEGEFELDFTGTVDQAAFRARVTALLPDGDRVGEPTLFGPFLKIGSKELYRLDEAHYTAFKALIAHQEIAADSRSEFQNGNLVLALQNAKKNGARLRLAHFENIAVVDPSSIGVIAQQHPSGDLLLSPALEGIDKVDLERRLGQLNDTESTSLRVKNQLIILRPEAREAVAEILTSRRIPREQVGDFIKNPTSYLTAAMIDLDTGFSLRVHGAERFELRYFGDTEAEVQDWFDGAALAPIPLSAFLSSVTTEAALNDVIERIQHARRTGADVVHVDDVSVSLADEPDPLTLCESRRESIDAELARPTTPPGLPEGAGGDTAVVAIDDNDEEALFAGKYALPDFDPSTQRFDSAGLARTPYKHQVEGIQWLLAHMDRALDYEAAGALLADDMGLGKTFMTLVGIKEWMSRAAGKGQKAKPQLIVAPVSLLANWQNEVAVNFKRPPFTDIVVLQSGEQLKDFRLKGMGSEVRQAVESNERLIDPALIKHNLKIGSGYGDSRLDMPGRLVLTTYQTLRDYQFSFARVDWGVVAFDEAQNLKNPNALVTRAAKGLKSDFKLLATGTPVENSLKDIWCLMDTCTPGLLGSWKQFREQYIQPILESKEEPAVKQRIGIALRQRVGNFMLRRTKEQSLDSLPTKTLFVGSTPTASEVFKEQLCAKMPPAQRKAYDEQVNLVRVNKLNNNRSLALPALFALRNISIHPLLANSSAGLGHGIDIEDSGKLAAIFTLLEEIRTKKEKCIVFVISKIAQTIVAAGIQSRLGFQVDIINGDTKASSKKTEHTRQGIIDKFQSAPGFGVIVMSPIAAGVGLNVTEANHVIHLERHWNPAKEAQATDRVYRIGQERPVSVYLPIAKHPELVSFDERLNSLLRNKIDLSDAVVAQEVVSEGELLSVL